MDPDQSKQNTQRTNNNEDNIQLPQDNVNQLFSKKVFQGNQGADEIISPAKASKLQSVAQTPMKATARDQAKDPSRLPTERQSQHEQQQKDPSKQVSPDVSPKMTIKEAKLNDQSLPQSPTNKAQNEIVQPTPSLTIVPQPITNLNQNSANHETFGHAVGQNTDRIEPFNAGPVQVNLVECAASSDMLYFCEKFARHMITRAMAVSELEKVLSLADDYAVNKMTDVISHTMHYAYLTYDNNAQIKTKIINIEPIPVVVQPTNATIDNIVENQLDDTNQSHRVIIRDDFQDKQQLNLLNDDHEDLLLSSTRQREDFEQLEAPTFNINQNMSYSFTLEQNQPHQDNMIAMGGSGMIISSFGGFMGMGMPQFDCGQIEVIDMDEEMEPEPPIRDGCVRYALKNTQNLSPEKRIRLAPKFIAPGVVEQPIPEPVETLSQASPSVIFKQSTRLKLKARNSQNTSMLSGITSINSKSVMGLGTTQKLKQFKLDPIKQFELAKGLHLSGGNLSSQQFKLEQESFSKVKIADNLNEDGEREINAQRRRVVGEEKRIMEEIKRQQEIDMMYEIMQKNAKKNEKSGPNQNGGDNNNITFDYEGKIIQICKPNEELLPETLNNPKIRFKAAQVQSNYMKEQLDRLFKQKQEKLLKEGSKSKKSNSVDQNSIQEQEISSRSNKNGLKKSNKLVDLYQTVSKDQEKGKEANIRPKPMGSNFNEMQPKPGIAIVENGKVKQNRQNVSTLAANKLSIEEYQSLKLNSSISQLGESRLNQLGEKSFSLPQLIPGGRNNNNLVSQSFAQNSNNGGGLMDYSLQETSILSGIRSTKAGIGGSIKRIREEALNDLIDLTQMLQPQNNSIRAQLRQKRANSEANNSLDNTMMTSDIRPLFQRRKPKHLMQSEDFGQQKNYKSQASLFVDTVGSVEAIDKLDQFNRYLIKDQNQRPSEFQVSKSTSNLMIRQKNDEHSYLKNAKELQRKHEKQVLKQTHFMERITGNNQSHLAKKLITTPRNVKLMQPLALLRQGKDVDLLSATHNKKVFL
eukprot:403371079